MKTTSAMAAALILAAGLACGGGGGGSPVLQPQYQPQITNNPDSFSLQLTGITDGSATLVYGWSNTGTAATVDRSSAITAGNVLLTLKDAAGATVYSGPLEGMSGSVASGTGVAGTWTVQTEFTHATGTINFRAQKL